MMKYVRHFLMAFVTMALLAAPLSGCITKTQKDAEYAVNQQQQKLSRLQARSAVRAPSVISNQGYYVNPLPISLEKQPKWMKGQITLHARNMPLNLLVSQVLRNTNVSATYETGTNQNMLVSIDYTGTIKGALDQIADDTNYAFHADNGSIAWKSFVTKTFNIAFMPGTSDYQVGQVSGGDTSASGSPAPGMSSSGSAGSGSNIVTMEGQLGGQQYSSLRGTLSVWQDLTTTMNDLKSPEGKVFVSESTTSVTVFDHPANVTAMERYINQLNKELSREVAIQVEVIEVTLNKDSNYGINWNVIQHLLGNQVSFITNSTDVTNILANQGAQVAAASAILRIGDPTGSNALLNALSSQGKVSVVTQPRVVTMNNQMAEIRITQDVSYLQSVSSTSAVNAGTTSSLTPGIVTDGFSLYLLPKIQGKKVYLQISSSLSTLTSIDRVNNIPQNLPSDVTSSDVVNNSTSSGIPYQEIQVPTMAEKQFNQRTVVSSGSTLIIAGFQQIRDEARRAQPLGIQAIGSAGAQRRVVQTIVLITPTILDQY